MLSSMTQVDQNLTTQLQIYRTCDKWFWICSFLSSDINECSSTPCQNGGTCNDAVNSYTCTCVAGYDGDNCENGMLTTYSGQWILVTKK